MNTLATLPVLPQRLHAANTPAWLARQTALAAGLLFLPLAASAAGVVMDCTEAALRGATAGGGLVTFACDGTITLSSTITNLVDMILDGTGHQVTISGGGAVRPFCVRSNVTLTLVNLTIANGLASDGHGGAILSAGGIINATNCTFTGNVATSPSSGAAFGGAIFSTIGKVSLSRCAFVANAARGVQAGTNYDAAGGAIYSVGTLTASLCFFHDNSASGGSGSPDALPGGAGMGGALYSLGVMEVAGSTFDNNSAAGGAGGCGASTEMLGIPAGAGLPGGAGIGGAVFGGGATALINCTFASNGGVGGAGGAGGESYSAFWDEPAGSGGNGGSGGLGVGAIWGQCLLTNCTLAFNSGTGGAPGAAGPAFNTGPWPSSPGTAGSQGGADAGVTSGTMVNTLLAANLPAFGISGVTVDAAHNLRSDTALGLIAPLADNGGPTLTMALLPGSPAIDAGDTASAPPTDQRGAPRPIGAAVDIGAYEAGAPVIPVPLQPQDAEFGFTASLSVVASGYPPLAYQWFFDATNALAGATDSVLTLTNVQFPQSGAYSVVVTNSLGAVTSSPATLTVFGGPPEVVQAPQGQAPCLGSTAAFSVGATGSPPLSYQWFFNTTNAVAGAAAATLQLTNVQLSQSGAYSVVVTNPYGAVTSPPALLSVVTKPPVITSSPASVVAWLGSSVTFQAAADACTPVAYQWFFNGSDPLPGATDATLCLTNLQPGQAGQYSLVAANPNGAATSALASLILFPPGTVTNSSEAALRAALAAGGTVTFASSGTITPSGTLEIARDTVLDGTGQDVTISGGNAVRVFYVDPNIHLTLIHLTITAGRSDSGAGIYNAGTLTASLCSFSHNSAQGAQGQNGSQDPRWPQTYAGAGTPAYGGALFNASMATATISGSTFDSNTAAGGAGGDGAGGGLIQHGAGPPSLVWGPTDGAAGAGGSGGAIYNSGSLTLVNSTCTANAASGGQGGEGGQGVVYSSPPFGGLSQNGMGAGSGGSAYGGALYNAGVAMIAGCTLAGNTSAGAPGGDGGFGYCGGDGGAGGSANGGAMYNCGTAGLVNSTLTGNTSAGAAGSAGANSEEAYGGNGGWGGSATGGGISGPCLLTNCTLVANSAIPGPGGAGGSSNPGYSGPPYGLQHGVNGQSGSATGGGSSGATMANTLLAANWPAEPVTSGTIDTNCNLYINTTAGVVGPLADNGGPTLTMSLLPGSPAIDAADTASAPPTDQRGFARPFGSAADIGAYEFGYPGALHVARPSGGGIDLSISGAPGLTCRLLASPDLVHWTAVATNHFAPDGTLLFHDAAGAGQTQKFYRVVMP